MFQVFVWGLYTNHIFWTYFLIQNVLFSDPLLAAEIRQKIGFSFLRGGTRNLGPAKRSFLDGGAWKIIGIYSRARMQFRCLFIYGAVASPTNETRGLTVISRFNFFLGGESRSLALAREAGAALCA